LLALASSVSCSRTGLDNVDSDGFEDWETDADTGSSGGGVLDDGRPRFNNIAFVTEAPGFDGDLNGLAGADQICNTRAKRTGLQGKYLAWLSTADGTSPAQRFVKSSEAYRRLDGVVIAQNWQGLTSGTLLAPLSVTESGKRLERGNVWTNTNVNGTSRGRADCRGFSQSHGSYDSTGGNILYTDRRWTEGGLTDCSTNVMRLYCFQQ
jgi:hypothetical protein